MTDAASVGYMICDAIVASEYKGVEDGCEIAGGGHGCSDEGYRSRLPWRRETRLRGLTR